MNDIKTLLGGLSVEEFLEKYWQKEPLLIRQALPGFQCPVTPEELAGLACEEDVESRLIMERGGEKPWQVEYGPFPEERFTALPATHWTVLVQEINKHVPEFALLQERFNFLPNWRLDDVMVSYAPEHGTVGPHADNYDVFLIQGAGHRRWQINRQEPSDDDLLPDLPLKIMKNFVAEEEWVLEPGDMLYLPPGVAHHGVALDNDCITISVGYRAPTVGGIISGYCNDALSQFDVAAFYRDPDLKPQDAPGEIALDAREAFRALIRSIPLDDDSIDRWFASYITDVRPGHYVPEPEEELRPKKFKELFRKHGELWRSEYTRYAHYTDATGVTRLYVAGEEYEMHGDGPRVAQILAGQRVFRYKELMPYLDDKDLLELLTDLYNLGALYFPED
ncbi:MAG: cupin domain-containing protein [Thiohalomonadaceae bacterium]